MTEINNETPPPNQPRIFPQMLGVPVQAPNNRRIVQSLLDIMVDGQEFVSIIDSQPVDPKADLKRALAEIEAIRGRPCICYVANLEQGFPDSGIHPNDNMPFNELVDSVNKDAKEIDVLVATPGGSGSQVAQFVDKLRSRFSRVEYIVPAVCMSAGTMWVMSGDEIWMDERATLGPIDPQVRLDGRFVPAQALLVAIDEVRDRGIESMKKGVQPDWTDIRLVDRVDLRLIGEALSMTRYSQTMVENYLEAYKFKSWTLHSDNVTPVTADERKARAKEISQLLAKHDRWNSHGFGINRDVANSKDPKYGLKLLIRKPEDQAGFHRALRRFWAMWTWVCTFTLVSKSFVGQNYSLIRQNKGGR